MSRAVAVAALGCVVATPALAKEIALARLLNQVTAGETVTVGADWIEPAKAEFSLGLVLINAATDRALVVARRDIRCSRGGVAGQFDASDKVVTLGPGAVETVTVVCRLPGGATGDYGIDLLRVYDDPARLGQPTERVLFEHVEWTLSEAQANKKAQKAPPGFVPAVTAHPVPPPADALQAAPDQPGLMSRMLDKIGGDGEKADAPFEVGTKEYRLARPRNQIVAGGGALTVGADAIHPQSDHYVVHLALVNDTDQGMAIPQSEIRCARGATQATLDYAAFGIGKSAIVLRPGEVRVLTMKCETGKLATGAFAITLGRVFADPGGSGSVSGDVLLRDVAWSIEEAGLDPALQTAP